MPPENSDRALATTDRVVAILGWLGALTVAGLVVLTGIGVFYRYVLNSPIRGLGDIIGLTLSICVALSLSFGARRGAHVAVDVVNMIGGRRVTRWTDIIVRALGVIIIGFACYALVKNGQCGLACAYATSSLSVSLEPYFYMIAAGFAVFGAVLLVELIVGIRHFRDDVDPSEKSK